MTAPSVGRIVHYRLTEQDAEAINKRRLDFSRYRLTESYTDTGYQAHYGNVAAAGDVYPAGIVRVWGTGETAACNLRVWLDGTDDLWALSRVQGDGDGQWSWPPRV